MYEEILRRSGRNRGRNKSLLTVSQGPFTGVNYVDSADMMARTQLPYAKNVDLGNPIGNISKRPGYESLITSLGTGGIKGLHCWEHSDGDKMIAAWSNYLYLLSGGAGSIAKTSQADWNAGTKTGLETASSPGDVKLNGSGTDFSETDTLTADFNGTHSNTIAANDSVLLDSSGAGGIDSYVTLMLHFDGTSGSTTFTDSSNTPKTVTANGNAQITNGQSVFGGTSGLFDGTGDYLSVPDNDAWNFGSGAFTIDTRVRFASVSGIQGICGQYNANTSNISWVLTYSATAGGLWFGYSANGSAVTWITKTWSPSINTWYHIEVCRTGNTMKFFVNGSQVGTDETVTATFYNSGAVLSIGATVDSGGSWGSYFAGWLDELRISKGIARHTSDFSVPTSAYNASYYSSGTYTHTEQNVSTAVVAGALAVITFSKTTPTNTTLTVEVNIYNGSAWGGWTEVSSGAALFAEGTDLTGCKVQWRANLTTTDSTVTPSLDEVVVSVPAGYSLEGTWISPVYGLGNTPLTATLSWVQTTPAGTDVTWYARGSSNGAVFGDWQEIATSGDAIPLRAYQQIKFVASRTVDDTPVVSSFLINYSASYNAANLLDISPLGRTDNKLTGNRVRMQDYEDNCYCADGLRPFVLYLDDGTAVTGTAQAGAASAITLAAGASAVNDFFNNAFITITGGTGVGQVRFISDYNGTTKVATVSAAWTTQPDATSTYSISSAVKVRKAGVDPPASALTAAAGASTGLTGTFLYKYTYVNRDGYESNPSASASVTVSSKDVALTGILVGDITIASRKVYRTKAGSSVYYYLTEIADNTTTTYTDTTADSALTVLMEDNNNIPPATCEIAYPFMTYMFYCSGDELWFSKATYPEQVPNISGDIAMNVMPSTILDIKSTPQALIPMGDSFINPITTTSAFIFDSDPTVDTTKLSQIDKNGSLSFESSDLCIDPTLRLILMIATNTGVHSILPGLQEQSIESVPISREIQSYYDLSVNRETMAGVFFQNKYLLSLEYQDPAAPSTERLTFVYDFRTKEWYGPWTFGMSCYTISGNALYGGEADNGKIYRMLEGSSDAGSNIKMVADLPMARYNGDSMVVSEAGTYRFKKFIVVASADSDLTNTIVKPKVDDYEVTAGISLSGMTSSFTGEERPGHNNIRSRKYPIPLPQGHSLSHRIEDDSTNPVSIEKIITTDIEVIPVRT